MSLMHLRSEKMHKSNLSLEDYQPYVESGVLEGAQITDWSPRPDEAFLSQEGMKKIEKALSELPVAYRIVFHLRDVEGLTNSEVAEILDISLPNVKSRIHRARFMLRESLSELFQ